MADGESARRPTAIGELRRWLNDMREPRAVPACFSDDDQLAAAPPGGQLVDLGHVQRLRALNAHGKFGPCLPGTRPVRGQRDGSL
jgi:hypothetical protein